MAEVVKDKASELKSEASYEANKAAAKDSNLPVGDRASAAVDAAKDKIDEKTSELSKINISTTLTLSIHYYNNDDLDFGRMFTRFVEFSFWWTSLWRLFRFIFSTSSKHYHSNE
jgi:hypothetical protein